MANRLTVAGPPSPSGGFTRLLARLDPDPDVAATAYERLRAALVKYFDWHGAWPPEECADQTLDRLAVKVAAGVQILDVRAYARGIAQLVLLEWHRRPAAVFPVARPAREGWPASGVGPDRSDTQLACLERCLATLPVDSRTLVLEYYVADRREKIENRRRLAQTLGLSESALRNRVQRLRDRLERCIQQCTEALR
jgi:DNA-directed RNA polymerase specialized sigma24 family protein